MLWNYKDINDLAEVVTKGTTPTTLGMKYSNEGIPFLRVQNLVNGKIVVNEDSLYISQEVHDALARSQIQPGDVLLSIAGTIGRPAIVRASAPPMNCNQAVAIIRLKAGYEPNFLRYWFETFDAYQQIAASKVTATISNLSLSQIKQLKVPIPPLAEQQRIVSRIVECMERVDEIRMLQAEMLKEADNIFESFVEAQIESEWTWQPIFEITTEVRNGWSWKESPTGQPIQVLRLSAVRNLSLDINEIRTVCLESKQSGEFSLKKDDVFMVRGNGSKHLVGRSAISTDDHPTIVFNDLLIRLRFTSEMLPEFANFMLHSRKVREQIEYTAKTAAGIWKINQTGIRSLKLPCPPISVQKEKLAALQEGLAASRQIVQHFTQNDTKALSAAILQKAFAGEL